ncbi:hypothetical protein B0H16DRAFT_520005 [Mycena metata]|uniref:Uncharacterized protein n=1 Tax=Mycena metata TaxID=1033252 RepID=A0AAD7H837_9AGAR|nr:hypothetical protein B0H16DRAFT_520005 [Mycena metata]
MEKKQTFENTPSRPNSLKSAGRKDPERTMSADSEDLDIFLRQPQPCLIGPQLRIATDSSDAEPSVASGDHGHDSNILWRWGIRYLFTRRKIAIFYDLVANDARIYLPCLILVWFGSCDVYGLSVLAIRVKCWRKKERLMSCRCRPGKPPGNGTKTGLSYGLPRVGLNSWSREGRTYGTYVRSPYRELPIRPGLGPRSVSSRISANLAKVCPEGPFRLGVSSVHLLRPYSRIRLRTYTDGR